MSSCSEDPFGRGTFVKIGYSDHPIMKPSSFPAAFELKPDWDPHCIGSYCQIPLSLALKQSTAILRRKRNEIDDLLEELSKLERSI